MNVKAQITMVLNLDKCLACHTCSIPCKNAWTTAPGSEYMWFNNVETKPGIGYPKRWEDQNLHKGGFELHHNKLRLRSGGKDHLLGNIFANPNLPLLDDYYQPWVYNYENLTTSPKGKHQPVAQPHSAITGAPMNPQWGANWEDDLSGPSGKADPNFEGQEADAWYKFQNVFMMHLPRLCEHCLNPACVASCPSGAMYKREEDGIVLADQTRCRSWRFCVSGCPYKKTYFNWKHHHAEKCLFCYPRVEAGLPTLCAHSCTGRIRYIGVMLYDADKVRKAASAPLETSLYEAQLELFLDPDLPEVREAAEKAGINHHIIEAARKSPIKKLVLDWRLALPLHPEFRTLPMVWYVPPTSPLREGLADEGPPADMPDKMRIPLHYLARLFTAGDDAPVRLALSRIVAMRRFMRSVEHAEGQAEGTVLESVRADMAAVGLTEPTLRAMYRLLALARHDERFVIPTLRPESYDDPEALKGCTGFPEELS